MGRIVNLKHEPGALADGAVRIDRRTAGPVRRGRTRAVNRFQRGVATRMVFGESTASASFALFNARGAGGASRQASIDKSYSRRRPIVSHVLTASTPAGSLATLRPEHAEQRRWRA